MVRDRVTVQEAETARIVGIEPATKPSWSRVGVAVVLPRGGSVLAFYPANHRLSTTLSTAFLG